MSNPKTRLSRLFGDTGKIGGMAWSSTAMLFARSCELTLTSFIVLAMTSYMAFRVEASVRATSYFGRRDPRLECLLLGILDVPTNVAFVAESEIERVPDAAEMNRHLIANALFDLLEPVLGFLVRRRPRPVGHLDRLEVSLESDSLRVELLKHVVLRKLRDRHGVALPVLNLLNLVEQRPEPAGLHLRRIQPFIQFRESLPNDLLLRFGTVALGLLQNVEAPLLDLVRGPFGADP